MSKTTESETMFKKLPPPNHKGGYWFGEPGRPPAILPIHADATRNDLFMLITEGGVVFDEKNRIKGFASAEEALKELRKGHKTSKKSS